MSRYLEILSIQRPFPMSVDTSNRVLFVCNYRAKAAGDVNSWEEEILAILSGAGVGTLNVDTFIGPQAVMPTGHGPYTTIIATGGVGPDETHNGDVYENLAVQIVVRASNFNTARTRALAIWRALDGVRNSTVTA